MPAYRDAHRPAGRVDDLAESFEPRADGAKRPGDLCLLVIGVLAISEPQERIKLGGILPAELFDLVRLKEGYSAGFGKVSFLAPHAGVDPLPDDSLGLRFRCRRRETGHERLQAKPEDAGAM